MNYVAAAVVQDFHEHALRCKHQLEEYSAQPISIEFCHDLHLLRSRARRHKYMRHHLLTRYHFTVVFFTAVSRIYLVGRSPVPTVPLFPFLFPLFLPPRRGPSNPAKGIQESVVSSPIRKERY